LALEAARYAPGSGQRAALQEALDVAAALDRHPQKPSAPGPAAALSLGLLLWAGPALAAAPALADVAARFTEARGLVASADLKGARAVLEDVLAAGHDGAHLRYDLGTLALEADDLGPAVWHLVTALRLNPGDDDAHHNLAVAQARRVDQLDAGAGGPPIGQGLPGFAVRLPPHGVRVAFGAALGMLGVVLLLLGLLAARPALGRLLGSAIVACLLTGGAFALRLYEEARLRAVVTADTTARKSPDEAGAEAFTAHPGLLGVVVDETAAFVRLRLDNGVDAWLPSKAVRVVP
jgi:hypothetical protein